MTPARANDLTGPLLKRVSRSFYLTLRGLPSAIRPQISLAYLLARASDTIADTDAVPRADRVNQLRHFWDTPVTGNDELLRRLPECFAYLATFDVADQQRIRELLGTIITGQIFDLERFPAGQPTTLTDAELDHYTYMVAGCVGEFWTKMCQAHLTGMEGLSVEQGIRFGKGLQLVNILRDITEDQRRGRQYLPRLDDYQRWLDTAVAHLDAGWQYTLSIPVRHWRVRLACTWPIWIGLETIARLRANTGQRVIVPRRVVNQILLRSILTGWSASALDRRYRVLLGKAGGACPAGESV